MQALLDWVEKRLPAMNAYKKHLSEYPMPKNFNFWYLFGSLAMLVLVNQLLTGIWLTMNYVPSGEGALLRLNTSCVMWSTAGYCVICIQPGLLHFRSSLSAHVPWFDLWIIPKAS